jgi:hypothetical protein
VSGKADLANVPTVFAGRWGDTTVALDPELFRGKVAVFLATPAAAGIATPRAPTLLRCDSVPNKFGAANARWSRPQCATASRRLVDCRHRRSRWWAVAFATHRAQRAGAVGVLLVALDETTRPAVTSAFNRRMTMQPARADDPSTLPVGAAILT